jgi:hypothetical protein
LGINEANSKIDLIPNEEKILYSKKDAARLLSISLRKLEYEIAKGEIERLHKGRRALITHRSLVAYGLRDGRGAQIPAKSNVDRHNPDQTVETSESRTISKNSPPPRENKQCALIRKQEPINNNNAPMSRDQE